MKKKPNKKVSKGGMLIASLIFILLSLSACRLFPRSEVAIIDIEGFIEPSMSKKVIEKIDNLRENNRAKAVVARVETPGGSVGSSQEIYEALKRLNKTKPVVVSMGAVAASGGYYISLAGRKVFANEGSITGSIGVWASHFYMGELMKKIGVGNEVIRAGKFKNISSNRPLNSEEKKFLQNIMDELRDQFVSAIVKNRKLKKNDVEKLADGKVYTGMYAKKVGLIDEIGDLYDAVEEAGKLAGIEGEPKTFRIKEEKPWFIQLFKAANDVVASSYSTTLSYVWR